MKFFLGGALILLVIGGVWFVNHTSGPTQLREEDYVADHVASTITQVEVYDGIIATSDMTGLDLSGRGLEGSLKAEIRQLSNLRQLDLSDNNFTGLPAEVGQLTELEVLNLANNPLTGLPHELGNLHNLKTLDLRGTQYSVFDLEIIQANLPETTNILTD